MNDFSPNTLRMLTEFFTSDTIEQTARRTGVVRRQSKITGNVFLLELPQGAIGISVRESTNVTLRNNHIFENAQDGIRIGLNVNTNIVVADSLIEVNGNFGILVAANAAATITRNTTRSNGQAGILVGLDSTADITDNLSEHNSTFGIAVFYNSSATISRNVSQHNTGSRFAHFFWGLQDFVTHCIFAADEIRLKTGSRLLSTPHMGGQQICYQMNDFGSLRMWKLSLFGHIWSNSPNCISKWASREL